MHLPFRELCSRVSSTRIALPLIFLGASFALYGNSLFGDFVYDDNYFRIQGAIRDVSYLWRAWMAPTLPDMLSFPLYRPLTYVTYSLNFLVLGDSPFWFHVVNVLLNGLACWLVFLIAERLFRERTLAWCTAGFFTILPIHTEAVAYIKARDELLVACLGLLAWLAFLRALEGTARQRVAWSIGSALCCLAAFLSKEPALVLPGVFAGSLLLLHGWRAVLGAWFPLASQGAAMLAFFGLHGLAVGWTGVPDVEILYFGQNPLGFMEPRFVPWTAIELFFVAVAKTFVPVHLSATYGFQHLPIIDSPLGSWMAPAGLLCAVTLVLLIGLPYTRRAPLGIGALTFLVLYFPFSKIPMVKGIDFFAERWLYGPSIGLSFIGGYAAWMAWKRCRQLAPVLFISVIVAYLFVLLPRNLVWRDETSLGESMVRDAQNSVVSYVCLANNRVQSGRFDEALELVTRGLQITRYHVPLHHTAAVVAMSMGQLDVAEQAVTEAESLGAEQTNDVLRSVLLAKQHRFQESLDRIRASPWFREEDYGIRQLLALDLWRLGRRDEAERFFDWDSFAPYGRMTREEKIQMIESY